MLKSLFKPVEFENPYGIKPLFEGKIPTVEYDVNQYFS